MAPAKCKTPAASKITKDVIAAVVADSTKKKDEDARKAAADKITELVAAAEAIDAIETARTSPEVRTVAELMASRRSRR